jgi:hypothetical protein
MSEIWLDLSSGVSSTLPPLRINTTEWNPLDWEAWYETMDADVRLLWAEEWFSTTHAVPPHRFIKKRLLNE